jgi:lipoate-protein ligase A
MRCIISNTYNPYFNLSTEEYFLKNSEEEIFILYINEPCIVAGRHQNLLSEINLRFAIENKIKLVRRISGGGTVYQDYQNLNFSFINNCNSPEQLSYSRFANPVLVTLNGLGLNAEFSERNDIIIEKNKISGSAMHIYKKRVLSHGTLLFNTDLVRLSSALQNNNQKYTDKSIKSVRSMVANISYHMAKPISINDFAQDVFHGIISISPDPYIRPLGPGEEKSINQISMEKFETWEWIYGYSPKYEFNNRFQYSDINAKVGFLVEKGIIKEANINLYQGESTSFPKSFEFLINLKHDYYIICESIKEEFRSALPDINISEFCYNLF